eukprot:364555-Chlamydomonas_euryale.AAC.5
MRPPHKKPQLEPPHVAAVHEAAVKTAHEAAAGIAHEAAARAAAAGAAHGAAAELPVQPQLGPPMRAPLAGWLQMCPD